MLNTSIVIAMNMMILIIMSFDDDRHHYSYNDNDDHEHNNTLSHTLTTEFEPDLERFLNPCVRSSATRSRRVFESCMFAPLAAGC